MKKLLVLSLLAVSATSFSAVVGTATNVEMPVKVRGEVVVQSTQLVITPIKNAGVDGASMEFDFGQMAQDSFQNLEGTFKVERADGTAIASTTIEIGMLNAATLAIEPTAQSTTPTGPGGGVIIDYSVTSNQATDDLSYTGTLAVKATVPLLAEVGNFLDTTKKVAVKA
ncbi:MAG: hypothetical protein ACRC0S_00070 [Fusobacteriaceae bacterium]